MDTKAIFLIDDYLTKRGIVDLENDRNPVLDRQRGRKFTFEDHLRGLIYSLLTNQRKWSTVEPKLPQIDKLFFNYNIEEIKRHDGTYFENGIKALRCGNISTKMQMEGLHKNIEIMEKLERKYGSMDAFVTSMDPEKVVDQLSSPRSLNKLCGVGPALAWEYLRNVGIDGSKPDLHMKRFFGSERMGDSKFKEATDKEIADEVSRLSKETGYSKFEVDYLIWCFCASGKGEICTSNPNCGKCVIRKYCKKRLG